MPSLRAPSASTKRSVAGIAKPEIIQVPEWNGYSRLIHGFSTRRHGHSTVYGGSDLNLGFTSADSRRVVQSNRTAFLNALLGRKHCFDLTTASQIHSDIIHVVDARSSPTQKGDGLITPEPGLLLAIQVADCVPVLAYDPENQVVAAFHAGWRGTVKRIVDKGVGTMRLRFGSDPQNIEAAIGPCIHQCCYAVGDDVVEEFRSQFAYADELFRDVYDKDPIKLRYPLLFMTARAPGHFNINSSVHLDLVEANRRQLLDAGLLPENIRVVSDCTACNKDYLWSHRAESGFAGRMMGVIGIRPR